MSEFALYVSIVANVVVLAAAVIAICWTPESFNTSIHELRQKHKKLDGIVESTDKYLKKVDAEQEAIWRCHDRLEKRVEKVEGKS